MTDDAKLVYQLGRVYALWFEERLDELKQLGPAERAELGSRLVGIANGLSEGTRTKNGHQREGSPEGEDIG